MYSKPKKTGTAGLRVWVAAVLLCELVAPVSAQSPAERRKLAAEQFTRAQSIRAALEARPEAQRTLKDYQAAVTSFRRVYRITPHAVEATAALLAVGELNEAMGRLYDRKYFQSAIDAYQFLIHEYPGSKHRAEAWLRVGRLQMDALGQPEAAQRTFEGYLKEYGRTPGAAEAQQALQKISAARATQQPPPRREAAQRSGPAAEVTGIRHWNAKNYTRVVVDLSAAVEFHSQRISNPDRIYFDLYPARLSRNVTERTLEIPGGFLHRIRVAPNQAGVVRVVLEVDQVQDYSIFLLENPFRLVVDAFSEKIQLAEKAPPTSPPTPAGSETAIRTTAPNEAAARPTPDKTPEPTRRGSYNMTRALGVKVNRIVIDPGHGGHDTGAIGPTGLLEKELCLDLALRLGRRLQDKLPGVEVIYTRTSDVYVPLAQRTQMANEAKADLFLSIHANSHRNPQLRGVETYYLSFASSPEALEVAAQENRMNQASMHELQELMLKIVNNEKIEESRELATAVQTELAKRLRRYSKSLPDRGVRKAPFVVLVGAKMPSVLAEVSYLSNPTDEKILKQSDHRDRIAEGLFNGVRSYLEGLNSLAILTADGEPGNGSR
ncbi:MAG: N-acetylmuramoyl-L-alanine amidase [Firmicutes bacterium]|nr:N-acetylmuramoyl-L-alanine amidase [Bacillota bacterium]